MRRRAALLLLPALAVLSPVLRLAAQDTPPLRGSDFIAKTRSGCRVIDRVPATLDTAVYKARSQAFYATANWEGACEHGLLTGKWTSRVAGTPIEYFYAYGRRLSKLGVERAGGSHA